MDGNQEKRRIRDILAPANTKRRLVLKLAKKFATHPVTCLKKVDMNHIKKFFVGLRSGSISSTSDRLDNYLGGHGEEKVKAAALPVFASDKAEDYEPLSVPCAEEPAVSIVIPVYNEFHYTYACLQSIVKNSGDVPYEVIIADDGSSDLTKKISEIVSGVRVIRNKKNMRFLLNCNNAAKSAKGEFILFLNNDTQVQENWLQPLVDLIRADAATGMVGSKLIYPDGRLQEAGGILWKDGSAWNFGHFDNPSKPEFNYVKEADYISGAAIMIRAELWRQIGGFDERFSPAYYEDTDLAFEVRRAGYKVLYQPKSVVIHFEGVSNGTDVTEGQKAYQEINAKKFYDKWKDVLEKEHNPNAVGVFRARDRSIRRKVFLIVDHYVPMFDKDAGSRYMFHYTRFFVEKGYKVIFLGDNFFPHQPYTEVLQQMGVEVIYGNWFAQHWKEWLTEVGPELDYIMLSRPHISIKYIDLVKKVSRAKVFYMAHDLHFWREELRYEATGEKDALKEAEKWKEIELRLMHAADVTITPSDLEVQKLSEIDPSIVARRWPINIFDHVEDVDYRAEERQDILFIGGFTHGPNLDAVRWAAEEVMPKVWEKRGEIRLHIVGSNAPAEVLALANERVMVHGYMTDEELDALYRSCRLELVPLRFGGGVKGKMIEAMVKGLPVVTTSVGTQGLADAEKFVMMGETAEELAEQIRTHYDDGELLKEISRKEVAFVRENFSREQAMKVLALDFDFS